MKEKVSGNKEEGDAYHASVPAKNGHSDEKGFVEKIKDKLPGQHKEAEHLAEEKGFVEKIKDKLPGQHKVAEHGAREKGFVEKIKEKLPGQHKEAGNGAHAEYHAPDGHSHDSEPKKGVLEKIKDKLPGGHKNEEKKHKEY
ncbi:dehydrin ERD14-like isoform X2 [Malus sylvestris]|nr:dehydrin ERD14-like isoform X2 [Malus sylvestris]